jgi:hypothetical protein
LLYVRAPLSVFEVLALTVQFAPGNIGVGAASKMMVGFALLIVKLPAERLVPALKFVTAAQSATTAYVPAFVGAVEEPSYVMLLDAPPPEQLTVAVRCEPLYVTGEFVTEAV